MSPPWLRGPFLINNQLNKGPGMEMSLSGSLRKLPISTCFKLAKKLLIVPTVICYVFISCMILNCTDKGGETKWNVKYCILASSHSGYFHSLVFYLHASCKFAQLEMEAVFVFCLSKMRLKYIKDICMFNYKPAAVPLCMCVCFLCNDSLLNVSDNLSNVTRPCSYLSLIRTHAGDGRERRASH